MTSSRVVSATNEPSARSVTPGVANKSEISAGSNVPKAATKRSKYVLARSSPVLFTLLTSDFPHGTHRHPPRRLLVWPPDFWARGGFSTRRRKLTLGASARRLALRRIPQTA